MTAQEYIEEVEEVLNRHPEIRFERIDVCMLKIFRADEKGFDIFLQTDEREHTLYFDNFHWHYENTEEESAEMLNLLILGLTGLARVKEFSKNGKAYKWTMQLQDKDSNWVDYGTMGQMNFNFWTNAKIDYLQNRLLPADRLFENNE